MRKSSISYLLFIIGLCLIHETRSDLPQNLLTQRSALELKLEQAKKNTSYFQKKIIGSLQILSNLAAFASGIAGGGTLIGAVSASSFFKEAQRTTLQGDVAPMSFMDYFRYSSLDPQQWPNKLGIPPYSGDAKTIQATESFVKGLDENKRSVVQFGLYAPMLLGTAFVATGLSFYLDSLAKTEEVKMLEQQIKDIDQLIAKSAR
jgi:hypothetical protein